MEIILDDAERTFFDWDQSDPLKEESERLPV